MVGPANEKHQAPTNGLKLYIRAVIKCKMFDLMHTPRLLGSVKRSDIEIVQISILICFGYDQRIHPVLLFFSLLKNLRHTYNTLHLHVLFELRHVISNNVAF